MKKREPEDEQLCITVHTIKCSIITPRQLKLDKEILKLLFMYCPTLQEDFMIIYNPLQILQRSDGNACCEV